MTVLALSSIPSDINTYERLAVWVLQCLQNTSNNEDVIVTTLQPAVPIAQCQAVVTADGRNRFILSAYIPYDQAAINDPDAKTWMAAGDIATATPHVNFTGN